VLFRSYYARSRNVTAFASERKALWKIGLKDAQRAIPGFLYSISERKLNEIQLARLHRPAARKLTINQASARLSVLLRKSILRITSGVEKVSVAFSGGLDSAVTALLAKKVNRNLEAVSVGLPGSQELSNVEQFTQELDLPITIETFGFDLLEEYVRRVVWLIEEPNLMKVSVAVPLHWAAMVAAKRGCRVMLCGQGSDELYGGYYKYARTLDGKGRKALVAELYRSVVDSAQVNYERDDQATAPFGVELRTAFADLDVIEFSLAIPSQFKVRAGNDLTRKWVLRNVAKRQGLPEDMIWRRKKAIQHGTGVENAIRKLAKKRGLTADGYLLKVHEEVIRMESMP
jgi:asparagine synthase (glutamine-hydrolysing)